MGGYLPTMTGKKRVRCVYCNKRGPINVGYAVCLIDMKMKDPYNCRTCNDYAD